MNRRMKRMIVYSHGSLNRRVIFNGQMKSIKDCLELMGYDERMVENYSEMIGSDVKDVTLKLIDYVYNGSQCTYEFKDRRKPKDLTGMRFGRLRVLQKNGRFYICQCDCGNTRTAEGYRLLSHEIRSCGCLRRENQSIFVRCKENGIVNDCRKLSYNGKTMTITEWSRQPEIINLGIKRRNIYSRLRAGWSVQRTLSTKSMRLRS